MKRLPYTPCKLYYDGCRDLHAGDYLRTPAGSAYLVQTIRQNGRRLYRQHLQCLRWPAAEIPPDACVHPLYWYSRNTRARIHNRRPGVMNSPMPAASGIEARDLDKGQCHGVRRASQKDRGGQATRCGATHE